MTCRVRRFLTILALADPASANLAQRILAHAYAKVKTLQMRHRPDWPKAEQFTRFPASVGDLRLPERHNVAELHYNLR